jgi:hypothetical protein
MTQSLIETAPAIAIALTALLLIAYAARVASMWHRGDL